MSKTNHRVNKERGERLGESKAHRRRRDFKRKASDLVEVYEEGELPELVYEDEDWQRYEKRKKPV